VRQIRKIEPTPQRCGIGDTYDCASENIHRIVRRAVSDAQHKCFIRTSELVQRVSGWKSRCAQKEVRAVARKLLRSACVWVNSGLGQTKHPTGRVGGQRPSERNNVVSFVRPERLLGPETSESRQVSRFGKRQLSARCLITLPRFLGAMSTGARAPIGVMDRSFVRKVRLPARFARPLTKAIREWPEQL
jgi:hypothetical protein